MLRERSAFRKLPSLARDEQGTGLWIDAHGRGGEPTTRAIDLDRVTHSAAAFDHAKLDWMNGEWIRRLTRPQLEARAMPIARARLGDEIDVDRLRDAFALGQERSVTLVDLVAQS